VVIAALEVGFHRVEHRPRQFLRHTLANRATFDQRRPDERFDGDVPAVAGDPFRPILEAGRLRPGAIGRCNVGAQGCGGQGAIGKKRLLTGRGFDV